METTSPFDLIGTVNDEEEKKNVVHSTTTKPIINYSLETEDNFETTHQNTDKVLVFIQICMGLIAIFCIIFGGVNNPPEGLISYRHESVLGCYLFARGSLGTSANK